MEGYLNIVSNDLKITYVFQHILDTLHEFPVLVPGHVPYSLSQTIPQLQFPEILGRVCIDVRQFLPRRQDVAVDYVTRTRGQFRRQHLDGVEQDSRAIVVARW